MDVKTGPRALWNVAAGRYGDRAHLFCPLFEGSVAYNPLEDVRSIGAAQRKAALLVHNTTPRDLSGDARVYTGAARDLAALLFLHVQQDRDAGGHTVGAVYRLLLGGAAAVRDVLRDSRVPEVRERHGMFAARERRVQEAAVTGLLERLAPWADPLVCEATSSHWDLGRLGREPDRAVHSPAGGRGAAAAAARRVARRGPARRPHHAGGSRRSPVPGPDVPGRVPPLRLSLRAERPARDAAGAARQRRAGPAGPQPARRGVRPQGSEDAARQHGDQSDLPGRRSRDRADDERVAREHRGAVRVGDPRGAVRAQHDDPSVRAAARAARGPRADAGARGDRADRGRAAARALAGTVLRDARSRRGRARRSA